MPYYVAGRMKVVRIETVDRAEPKIDPLAPLLRGPAFANAPRLRRGPAFANDDDDDPEMDDDDNE